MACKDGDQGSSETSCKVIYQECLRESHTATFARVQGYKCDEFRPSGEKNSLETVWCGNCGCYIKHHRKVIMDNLTPPSPTSMPATTHVASSLVNLEHHAGKNGVQAEEEEEGEEDEEGIVSVGEEMRRKRRRLREEQKQRVLEYAKTVNWRVKKQDEGKMLEFCADIGISTEVCRNWINNHRKKISGAGGGSDRSST